MVIRGAAPVFIFFSLQTCLKCAVALKNRLIRLPGPSSDPRRTAAEAMVAQLGPGSLGAVGAMGVLGAYPVHNPHTAYTAIMQADAGSLRAFVRVAMCPESPNATTLTDPRYCMGPRQ